MPIGPPGAQGAARAAPWALRGLFAISVVFALREARPLLAPVVIAIVLTFVLAPVVRWLRRRGVPEVLGAALLVAALLASTVPLAASLATPAAQWWEKAPTTVAQLLVKFDQLRAAIPGLAPPKPPPALRPAARHAAPAPAPPADPLKDRLASEGVALTGMLLGQGASFALSASATLILLYFLLASEHWMLSRCVEALPRRRTRALLLGGVRSAQREIGRFIVTVGIVNVAVGVLMGLTLWLLGMPNPTLWGAVVAVLSFVPYLGPLVIATLLALAGSMTFVEPSAMLAPAVAFVVVHAVESNVVSPWFVGRRLSMSPISVFLSVMFWGWLWGIAGALIAVPLLIALRSFCLRTRGLRLLRRFLEGDRRTAPTLSSLLRRPRAAGRPIGRASVPIVAASALPAEASRARSEAEHVAEAGGVDLFAAATVGELDLVAGPVEHHA